ncbi:hypothetical protein B7P33_12845 [Sediminicola luteus]|uniref:Uncharacterized protein n=1 Tax=Sediminicola luteus TaxID=319238 RepID=A0A2A4G6Q6_9FLAO|nr:hypothetical protein B7P33_12845 [Sediminicola luteus]
MAKLEGCFGFKEVRLPEREAILLDTFHCDKVWCFEICHETIGCFFVTSVVYYLEVGNLVGFSLMFKRNFKLFCFVDVMTKGRPRPKLYS